MVWLVLAVAGPLLDVSGPACLERVTSYDGIYATGNVVEAGRAG
jgi:hypothetical protein